MDQVERIYIVYQAKIMLSTIITEAAETTTTKQQQKQQ